MKTDTLIIGSGIAGGTAALTLSDNPNHQVTVITRAPNADDSNSAWAQGGIVTRGLDDSPDLLVEDILRAGAGESHPRAARLLANEGPHLVERILMRRCGVNFDRQEDGALALGLEGAHSTRRVVHVGDQTGAAIVKGLLETLAARPNVTLLTAHTAVDFITHDGRCYGAFVLHEGVVEPIIAGQTILATGGIGQIYQNTTNPDGARGDGLAMAIHAGLRIDNAEYVQFHPTALHIPGQRHHLISEAVRGEGAVLLTPDGERFMHRYAPEWLELAPRDVVARAIHTEMQVNNYDHVLLDIASQHDADFIRRRFPQLIENAANAGIDATCDPLPVVPAAHYFCGGIPVDSWGRTQLGGLYAVGEVSCTGLHGANRLASTSLLEGLVWGHRAAQHIGGQKPQTISRTLSRKITSWRHTGERPVDKDQIAATRAQIQALMWQHVGLVRHATGLKQAQRALDRIAQQVERQVHQSQLSDDLIGLRSAVQVARVVTGAALANRSSKGGHYRMDAIPAASNTTLGALTGD